MEKKSEPVEDFSKNVYRVKGLREGIDTQRTALVCYPR